MHATGCDRHASGVRPVAAAQQQVVGQRHAAALHAMRANAALPLACMAQAGQHLAQQRRRVRQQLPGRQLHQGVQPPAQRSTAAGGCGSCAPGRRALGTSPCSAMRASCKQPPSNSLCTHLSAVSSAASSSLRCSSCWARMSASPLTSVPPPLVCTSSKNSCGAAEPQYGSVVDATTVTLAASNYSETGRTRQVIPHAPGSTATMSCHGCRRQGEVETSPALNNTWPIPSHPASPAAAWCTPSGPQRCRRSACLAGRAEERAGAPRGQCRAGCPAGCSKGEDLRG